MRLAVIALLLSGCGLGHLVHPDDPVRLGATDGLLALDIDAPGLITLTLCRDADYASCLTTGPMATDRPVQLYQTPAGTYCVLQMLFEPSEYSSITRRDEAEDSACLQIPQGVITDPGTFVVDRERALNGHFDWRWDRVSGVGARVAAEYPDLAAVPIVPTEFVWYRGLHPR